MPLTDKGLRTDPLTGLRHRPDLTHPGIQLLYLLVRGGVYVDEDGYRWAIRHGRLGVLLSEADANDPSAGHLTASMTVDGLLAWGLKMSEREAVRIALESAMNVDGFHERTTNPPGPLVGDEAGESVKGLADPHIPFQSP